ncbi:hypothetical protein HY78_14525 [Rhizorhabdus wittichii DC-6]|nr:hypothetical protein HY78_14525 [Rhizorhabdus wittichii DC-6]
MTSIREQICAILDARLQAIADDHAGEYERDPAADPIKFPALSLIDNGQRPSEEESDTTRYAMDIAIEVFAEGSGGLAVSQQLNELHAAIVSAVMEEPPIEGLAEGFEEGVLTRSTATLADQARKGFRQDFIIIFPTRRGDPASQ